MNDGLFSRDLLVDDDVWIGGASAGLGRSAALRLPMAPVLPTTKTWAMPVLMPD